MNENRQRRMAPDVLGAVPASDAAAGSPRVSREVAEEPRGSERSEGKGGADSGAQQAQVELPIRIQSEPNERCHWAVKARRAKAHRNAALAIPKWLIPEPPCVVILTRIGPRKLDDDNLAAGFKALRDGIADRLGVDDGDSRVEWRYAQAKGRPKQYAAKVQFMAKGAE